MKDLINDIKDRLAATQPVIRYIDEDWGQLDNYAANPPAKWPCVLVDLLYVPWTNQGDLIQTGIAQVILRVADLRLSNSNIKAPASQRAKATGLLDILTSIHKKLHGWTADSMNGPLSRISTKRIRRDDGIREYEMIYSVQLVDKSAQPVRDTISVTPGIRVVITKPD